MLDEYLKEKIKFYIQFLRENTLSASQRIYRIENAVISLETPVKTKEEYVSAYKGMILIKDIIYEMCDNYLVDEHTQEVLKDKMNALSKSLSNTRSQLEVHGVNLES